MLIFVCGSVTAGKMSGGFGIGALEDLGDEDEDVYDQGIILINSNSFFSCILLYLLKRFYNLNCTIW